MTAGATEAQLRHRLRLCERLADEVQTEITALRDALHMYDDAPPVRTGRPVIPFTYTADERREAHRRHQAGEQSAWVRQGEREYQRAWRQARRAQTNQSVASP